MPSSFGISRQVFVRNRLCQTTCQAHKSTQTGPAYQSLLATDHFQRSLPRLQVPSLDKTLERYINSQKAVLSSEQLAVTQKACETFTHERGPQLQRQLEEYAKANKHTSYITDLWFDMYLRDRRPVVLNHNPVMVLKDSELGSDYQKPAVRATNLTFGVLHFNDLLRSNRLAPEVFHLNPTKSDTLMFQRMMRYAPNSIATYLAYLFKAYPLDMSQYPNMLNATRIPQPEKDELFRDPSARHLLVIHRGQLYVFDVYEENGDRINARQLLSNLQFILSRPPVTDAPGVGVITTMARDDAVAARERLVALGNGAALAKVDSALFALVLDDEPLMDDGSSLLNFLTGPSQSRWFDKSISLLIDRTGRAAVNFEHSWGDGVAVVRMCEEMIKLSDTNPAVGPSALDNDSLPSPTVNRLEWLLDNRTVQEMFQPAREAYDERRHSVVLQFTQEDSLSKKLCKQAKLSPDAMMQLSFQRLSITFPIEGVPYIANYLTHSLLAQMNTYIGQSAMLSILYCFWLAMGVSPLRIFCLVMILVMSASACLQPGTRATCPNL